MQEIKNAAVPYNTVGLLEVRWTPLAGPNEEDFGKPVRDVESEDDLIGQSWTYRLEIKRAADLPVFCDLAYVSYEFFGESFMTEAVQQTTFSPQFDYTKVHHIPCVTKEFVAFLKGAIEMQIHVNQHIEPPPDKISTRNEIIEESIRTGEPKGYEYANTVKRPKSEAEVRCDQLVEALTQAQQENSKLRQRVKELEGRLRSAGMDVEVELEVGDKGLLRQSLKEAKILDIVVNGNFPTQNKM